MGKKRIVSGLNEFRENLTENLQAARNGEIVEIEEFGKDRQPKAIYELKKIKDLTKGSK